MPGWYPTIQITWKTKIKRNRSSSSSSSNSNENKAKKIKKFSGTHFGVYHCNANEGSARDCLRLCPSPFSSFTSPPLPFCRIRGEAVEQQQHIKSKSNSNKHNGNILMPWEMRKRHTIRWLSHWDKKYN